MSRFPVGFALTVLLFSSCDRHRRPLDFSRAEYIGTWYLPNQINSENESHLKSVTYTLLADSFFYRCDYLTNSFSDDIELKKAELDSGEWQLENSKILFQGTAGEVSYSAEFASTRDTLYFRGSHGEVKALLRGESTHVSR